MGKRTDKAKRDAKFAFRKQRSETITRIRAEREAAFAEMFADVLEDVTPEQLDDLANGLTIAIGDQKVDMKPVRS